MCVEVLQLSFGDQPGFPKMHVLDSTDPAQIRAFVTSGWQGVNYAKGVWHHPLIALGDVSDFIVVDRGGDGLNLNEQDLAESLWLTEDALSTVTV